MTCTSFTAGDVAAMTVDVKDAAGVLVNPATVALQVKFPDGSVSSVTPIANPSTGKYSASLSLTMPGWHSYRWETAGGHQGVIEGGFSVSPQSF